MGKKTHPSYKKFKRTTEEKNQTELQPMDPNSWIVRSLSSASKATSQVPSMVNFGFPSDFSQTVWPRQSLRVPLKWSIDALPSNSTFLLTGTDRLTKMGLFVGNQFIHTSMTPINVTVMIFNFGDYPVRFGKSKAVKLNELGQSIELQDFSYEAIIGQLTQIAANLAPLLINA